MPHDPRNIIIKMPNWLGDAVMATPVLSDVRSKWPQAKLTAMCQSNIEPLLAGNPHVNEIFSYKKPSGWIHRAWHKDVIVPLQHGEYDLGILLTNSLSSAWWFWKGHVKNRIGFAKGIRGLFLDKAIPFPKNCARQHLVHTYKMLIEQIGIPLSATSPKLYLSEEEKKTAAELLKRYGINQDDIIVGINPGAAYGSAKCWLPDRFKEVTKKLLEKPNLYVLFFGDYNGKPLVDQICKDMPERVLNLAGKTKLRELMALINACSLFLTNDSGPMHIASALHVPLLALFGSTSQIKTGPYNGGQVIHKHVECSPCYLRTCPKPDFPCMTRISSDEVLDELKKMIEEGFRR